MAVGNSAAPYTPTISGTTNVATGQPATLVPTGLNQAYSYDSFGNLLQNGSFNTSYTAYNQMFGYAYDAAGNLLSNGLTTMTWDAENRITSISTDGKTVTSQITVSIPNGATGTALDGIVGHEGTHVDQGEALLGSFKPNGSFNGTLNLSSYGRELPAYQNQANIWQQSGQSWTMNGNGQFVINPGDAQGQVNNTINQF